MSLIYFHRFLIGCAILFSLYFAWRSFGEWQQGAGTHHLIVAIASAAAGVGLAFYLRTVRMPPRRRG